MFLCCGSVTNVLRPPHLLQTVINNSANGKIYQKKRDGVNVNALPADTLKRSNRAHENDAPSHH